ncbi:MAG: hypothetical protein WC523_00245 [Patescibacteria group bacterium]
MNLCKVGELIRIEWNKDSGEVRVVIDITDPAFKSKILHNEDFKEFLTIKGSDAMIVASKYGV